MTSKLKPWLIISLFFSLELAIISLNFQKFSPLLQSSISIDQITSLLFWQSALPRLCLAFLAGASLSLAGVLLQHALRNPLAAPSTLGIAAGAKLALSIALVWMPELAEDRGHGSREFIAILGSICVIGFILFLSWRENFSPVNLLLAGMVLNLFCAAAAAALAITYDKYLEGLFLWGAGSLSQQDWQSTLSLLPRFLLCLGLSLFFARNLGYLHLPDAQAKSLGVPVLGLRIFALVMALGLTAFCVSAVGVIGFIGLAGPALASLIGFTSLRARLIIAPALGGTILVIADQIIQFLAGDYSEYVPTGAATALIGAPLLLWFLPRMTRAMQDHASLLPFRPAGHRKIKISLLYLLPLILILSILVLMIGRQPEGWHFLTQSDVLLTYRLPRFMGAACAGALLGAAGAILQRLTRNPLASPEVIGVSAGAAFGYMICLFLIFSPQPWQIIAFSACSAFMVLGLIMIFATRSHFSPNRMLLIGLSLTALFDAMTVVFMVSGDPRGFGLLVWLTGSTYSLSEQTILPILAVTILCFAMLPFCYRWLHLSQIGPVMGRAIGVPAPWASLSLLGLAALMSATATLCVGPFSFAGLIGPHIARLSGYQSTGKFVMVSALFGAVIMACADFIGRQLLYPNEIPAGLTAAIIGTPMLLWLLTRKTSSHTI